MTPFAEPDTVVAYARSRWEEGEHRVQRHEPRSHRRETLERVVEGIMTELERRVGQIFSTMELAQVQDDAEVWCTSAAHELAPESPWAWELDTVQNAAFHRYSRRATDYQMGLQQ